MGNMYRDVECLTGCTYISRAYILYISGKYHISHSFVCFVRHISGISQLYHNQIQGTSLVYLMHISGISKAIFDKKQGNKLGLYWAKLSSNWNWKLPAFIGDPTVLSIITAPNHTLSIHLFSTYDT